MNRRIVERRGYLVVPRNRQGLLETMEGLVSEEDNVLYIPISRMEADASAPLLQQFERSFGFDAEGMTAEQLIDTRCATLALDLALSFLDDAMTPEAESAARKIAEALEAALRYGSFVEFDFSSFR